MSAKGYLTAEEYRTIRQTLGFTQEEAARFHNVQNVRTIKRWEKGDSWVSELACDKIMALFRQVNTIVNAACDQIKTSFDNLPKDKWKVAVLIQYPDSCYKQFVKDIGDLPNSIHKTMIQRVYVDLNKQGYPVGIITFNPQDYFTFLSAQGLKDTQDARALWATTRYSD